MNTRSGVHAVPADPGTDWKDKRRSCWQLRRKQWDAQLGSELISEKLSAQAPQTWTALPSVTTRVAGGKLRMVKKLRKRPSMLALSVWTTRI